MDISYLETLSFFYSLGYVTLVSVILTIVLEELIKVFLKLFKVITKNTNSVKKDIILSRIGRIIALISYASIYIIDVLFIKHAELILTLELITSLLSGSCLTLCISKGIYTGLRQMSKKKNIFDKLDFAEVTIKNLESEIKNNEFIKNDNQDALNLKQTYILGRK